MKNINVIFLVCLLFFSSCGKKSNKRLAENYHKLALLELQEHDPTEESSIKTFKKSLMYIDKAIDQDYQARYLAFKATLLFNLKHYEESEKYYQKSLEQCDDIRLKAEILNNYACLCVEMGRDQKALKIWNELENNKEYLTPKVISVNRGKLFASKGDLITAKQHFLKAVNQAPNFVDAHYYTALIGYHMNDQQLLKDQVSTVLFLEPEHQGAKHLKNFLL